MWGAGYAGFWQNPSGKWCGIIGLSLIQGEKRGLLCSPAGMNPLATDVLSTDALATEAPDYQGLRWLSCGGVVNRTPAVSVC